MLSSVTSALLERCPELFSDRIREVRLESELVYELVPSELFSLPTAVVSCSAVLRLICPEPCRYWIS